MEGKYIKKTYNVLNKKTYTLILKTKWFWNKKRIWNNEKFYNNFIEIWKKGDKLNPEESVYFHFSRSLFLENKIML